MLSSYWVGCGTIGCDDFRWRRFAVIVGTGCDIVSILRVERLLSLYPEAFIRRCFTGEELARLDTLPQRRRAEFCAARIAAKEAFVKALGTGFAYGVGWRSVEVCSADSGAPFLRLHDQAYTFFVQKASVAHTSLSHDRSYAMALVVLEKGEHAQEDFDARVQSRKEDLC